MTDTIKVSVEVALMKVIGLVGLIGSGKDEFVDYLEKRYAIPSISTGDIARNIAAREGLPLTRGNLHAVSRNYMEKYGRDVFARILVDEEIEIEELEAVGVVCITGIRTQEDVAALRDRFGDGFFLVHLKSSEPALRYERIQRRNLPRDPKTYHQFLEQDQGEEELFQINETIRFANAEVENQGTLDLFHRNIDELVARNRLADETMAAYTPGPDE